MPQRKSELAKQGTTLPVQQTRPLPVVNRALLLLVHILGDIATTHAAKAGKHTNA